MASNKAGVGTAFAGGAIVGAIVVAADKSYPLRMEHVYRLHAALQKFNVSAANSKQLIAMKINGIAVDFQAGYR